MKQSNHFTRSTLDYKWGSHSSGRYQGTMAVLLFFLIYLISQSVFTQPLAEGFDKFLGASTSSDLSRYFDDYWNQVTPGNNGKWGSVETSQDNYNWAGLDKIYDFAVKRDMPFKEHTLVWGNQQPGWINSLDSASQREQIEEWIRLIGERYPLMAYVDVVNEPFHFFFSSRRRHTRSCLVSWARRCV